MDRLKDTKTFAKQWVEAWNNRDLEAVLSHYSEDIQFTSPFAVKIFNDPQGMVKGKAALRDYFSLALSNYPSFRFELISVLEGVQSVTLYYLSVNQLKAAEVMFFNEKGQVNRVEAHYSP